jgi:TonB family protein
MKKGGTVLVYLEIDTSGNPVNVRILRGCGYGLDEEAVEAVRHYRFKPAKKDGVPVQVRMNVEVNFEIKT